MSPMEQTFARSLESDLRAACSDALGNISWVRMDWQHGGALTGVSEFTDPAGTVHQVFVKFPVPGRELRWTRHLQNCGEAGVVPVLHASGSSLGNHDIAWLVLERLPGLPLGAQWEEGNLRKTADAAAQLQACASGVSIDRPKRRDDWELLLERTQKSLAVNQLPDHRAWVAEVKSAARMWDSIIELWRSREPIQWIHGDLHLANAMQRTDGSICLVDLAEVRPGHWLEDALYLERLSWAHPDRVRTENPVEAMMACRKRMGLKNGPMVQELAAARRILLSATTPAFLAHEGSRPHLEGCLNELSTSLKWWSRHQPKAL
jgi:hypothetical protein